MSGVRFVTVCLILCFGATATHAQVVISQIYGGGGNSGAPLNRDFVELYNRGDQPMSLGGLSIQYASATGTGNFGANANQLVALPATVLEPGQYFLLELAGGSNGVALPTPDAVGAINMAASAGKVALVTGAGTLGCNGGSSVCSAEQIERILDLVGYGSANFFEGNAAAPTLSNSLAGFRQGGGCTDTDDNSADVVTGAPMPRNTTFPLSPCAAGPVDPEEPPPPITVTPIHAIQADGLGSPLLGSRVVTEGVVTARRTIGYFIQTAQGEDDGDPATAEGLFVFTGSSQPPPDAAQVGNRVRVTGTVGQFERVPHGYPLTQLVNSSVELLATGVPLPSPIVLGTEDLDPDMFVGRLGRYQGMRIELPAAVVTGPTNRFGDFYVTLPGVSRPFREPGIAVLDTVPVPPELAIPSWDRNPERLRVESTGLVGGSPLFLDVGDMVENLTGIMYFDRDDFTMLVGELPELTILRRGLIPEALPRARADQISIVSFNIENLSGGANVPTTRLDKLSQVFCSFLDTPDIVGLIEIADLATLERLATAINEDEFGHCPEPPEYQAYLLAQTGTQRLGYLVSTRKTTTGAPRVDVLTVAQLAADELLVAPDGSTNSGPLFDRPPLLLRGDVYGPNGERQPVNVLLTHNLSLLAVRSLDSRTDAWVNAGNRSRGKRLAQAVRLAELAEAVQVEAFGEPFLLIGDFNAFELSDGYVDVMGILTGDPAPPDQVLVHAPSPLTSPLHNLTLTLPEELRYSYVFQGSAQNLDHMLVNDAVFEVASVEFTPVRLNSDFAADNADTAVVPMGTSDHDPLSLRLGVGRFVDADLSVTVVGQRPPLLSGREARLSVLVGNLGPEAASQPVLLLELDVPPDQVGAVRAANWSCGIPTPALADSEIRCARDEALPASVSERFEIPVLVRRVAARDSLTAVATVTAASNDPDFGNNRSTFTWRVAGAPAVTPVGR